MYRTYENAKLLEEIIMEFKETPLEEPKDLDEKNQKEVFKWQLDMKEYYKDKTDLKKLKFALWSLLCGQSTDIVKKKLKALDKFEEKEKERDVAWLFRSLRQICSRIDNSKHFYVTL